MENNIYFQNYRTPSKYSDSNEKCVWVETALKKWKKIIFMFTNQSLKLEIKLQCVLWMQTDRRWNVSFASKLLLSLNL